MSLDSFEKTSWNWQFTQLQQQVGEWIEYQFSGFQFKPELPNGWQISPWLFNALNFIFWLLLSLFLLWVGWRLWRSLNPYLYAWLAKINHSRGSSNKGKESEVSVAIWLGRSQEFYRQGNYSEACRCLYFAMLQHLHDRGVLPHKPSRTDGEYLQLLQMSVTPVQPYETLITTHEQLCFSNVDVNSENYEHCQQAYEELSANG
ncbi:DUF4129 domain-containing protein [Scytonema sp. NUACC26]|uniref:DUF4129 domain-containing protein n=1 Tax=Scytonema sp. NUACC26 TaxID=3140176 RepID=UPI0034DCB565